MERETGVFNKKGSKYVFDKLAAIKTGSSVYDALLIQESIGKSLGEIQLEFKIALNLEWRVK